MRSQYGGFDTIVSLGYNCEVSFRIEDYLNRKIDSYPLSWVYTEQQSLLPQVFQKMMTNTLLEGQYTVNPSGMFLFDDIHCASHSKAENKPSLRNSDGTTNYREAKKALPELTSRMSHLNEKWRRLIQSTDSVLFVMKLQNDTEERMLQTAMDVSAYIQQLMIRPHHDERRYFLLIVAEELRYFPALEKINSSHVAVDTIPRFAPDGDTKEGGCVHEWLQLIDYYDHAFDAVVPNRRARLERINRMEVLKGTPYAELKAWCDELQKAKDWLAEQYQYLTDELHRRDNM